MNNLQPGDYRDIDEYIAELRDNGYDAEYENLWSGTSGFTAKVKVNGETHAFFEGSGVGHMVKDVRTPLDQL